MRAQGWSPLVRTRLRPLTSWVWSDRGLTVVGESAGGEPGAEVGRGEGIAPFGEDAASGATHVPERV